jgi:hypothetical protein
VARTTIIQLTDDLDGKAIKDGNGETVTFALEGTSYEIDLSKKNADDLRDVLAKYISAGRRVSIRQAGASGGRGRSSRASSNSNGRDYDPKAVRAWAESQGIEVSARGRVPSDLVTKFQDANAHS